MTVIQTNLPQLAKKQDNLIEDLPHGRRQSINLVDATLAAQHMVHF